MNKSYTNFICENVHFIVLRERGREMKKLVVMCLLAVFIMSLMTSCGKNTNKNEYTLSEYINGRQTIWFVVYDSKISKDSDAEYVVVLNEDGTYISQLYYKLGLKLGDLSQMSDEEIVEAVTNSKMEDIISYCDEEIELLKDTSSYIIEVYSAAKECATHFGYDVPENEISKSEIREYLSSSLPFIDSLSEEDKEITLDFFTNKCYNAVSKVYDAFEGSDEGENIFKIFYEWGFEDGIYTEENWKYIKREYDYEERNRFLILSYEDAYNLFSNWCELVYALDGFNRTTEYAYDLPQEYIEGIADAVYTLNKDEINRLEEMKTALPAEEYELYIYSDETGNNTATEELKLKSDKSNESFMLITLNPQNDTAVNESGIVDGGTQTCYQIYDSLYDGYRVTTGEVILTRVDKDINFILDAVGTDGIIVDPE